MPIPQQPMPDLSLPVNCHWSTAFAAARPVSLWRLDGQPPESAMAWHVQVQVSKQTRFPVSRAKLVESPAFFHSPMTCGSPQESLVANRAGVLSISSLKSLTACYKWTTNMDSGHSHWIRSMDVLSWLWKCVLCILMMRLWWETRRDELLHLKQL